MSGLFEVADQLAGLIALVASWVALYLYDRWVSRRERRGFGPDATLAARYGGSRSWGEK